MGIGVLDLFFAVCCIFYLPKTIFSPPSFNINMSIPFASLKAQNAMKRIGTELFFYYPTAIGITVNYKSRGGEWDTPSLE